MNGPHIIRTMLAGDIPSVLSIQAEAGLSHWSAESYRQALTSPDFLSYVAQCEERLAGFLLTRLITSEKSAEILNIAVLPEFHKQEIGGDLLAKLFGEIHEKINMVFLEVRDGNGKAIAFYKKHGFYEVGKRINYYSDPAENALLMEKKLN